MIRTCIETLQAWANPALGHDGDRQVTTGDLCKCTKLSALGEPLPLQPGRAHVLGSGNPVPRVADLRFPCYLCRARPDVVMTALRSPAAGTFPRVSSVGTLAQPSERALSPQPFLQVDAGNSATAVDLLIHGFRDRPPSGDRVRCLPASVGSTPEPRRSGLEARGVPGADRHGGAKRAGRGVIRLDRQADQGLQEREIAVGVQMDLRPVGVRDEIDATGGGKGRAKTADDLVGEEDFGQVVPVKVNELQVMKGQSTTGRAVRTALPQRPVLESIDHQVGVRDGSVCWAHGCQSGGRPVRTADQRVSWWNLPIPGSPSEFLVRSWNCSRTCRYALTSGFVTSSTG